MSIKDFTEMILKFGGNRICEVGPGVYFYPYVSVKKKKPKVDYILVDAAEDFGKAQEINGQIGGISEYICRLKEMFPEIHPPRYVIAQAHNLPDEEFDSILFFKVLEKLGDIILSHIFDESGFYKIVESEIGKKDVEKYKKFYSKFVLKIALERTEKVIVVPSDLIVGKNLAKEFEEMKKFGIKYEKISV